MTLLQGWDMLRLIPSSSLLCHIIELTYQIWNPGYLYLHWKEKMMSPSMDMEWSSSFGNHKPILQPGVTAWAGLYHEAYTKIVYCCTCSSSQKHLDYAGTAHFCVPIFRLCFDVLSGTRCLSAGAIGSFYTMSPSFSNWVQKMNGHVCFMHSFYWKRRILEKVRFKSRKVAVFYFEQCWAYKWTHC